MSLGSARATAANQAGGCLFVYNDAMRARVAAVLARGVLIPLLSCDSTCILSYPEPHSSNTRLTLTRAQVLASRAS